jgi:hypothetical protein
MANCLVLFDHENQLNEVQHLLDWYPEFNFTKRGYSIKDGVTDDVIQLISDNQLTKIIFLIGSSTRYLHSNFKKDTEEISKLDLPIICFNINKCLGTDEDNCPKFMASIGAVHMPFTKKDVVFTLTNHKQDSRKEYREGSYYMKRNFQNIDPMDS